MAGDMTKPRANRHKIEDIINHNQREVTRIVIGYIKASGLTIRQFADASPEVSYATITKMESPNSNYIPSRRILNLLSLKIATLFRDVNPEYLYAQLLKAGGYDVNTDDFNKPNSVTLDRVEYCNLLGKAGYSNIESYQNDKVLFSRNEYAKKQVEFLRAKTTIEQIFKAAKVQNGALTWNSENIENILKIAYPDMYIKLLNSK
jgi:hypothetical protein